MAVGDETSNGGEFNDRRTFIGVGLLLLTLGLGFLLGYCRPEGKLPSVNAFEACQDINEVDDRMRREAASLCNNPGLSDGDRASIDIQACPNNQLAEVRFNDDLLFVGGMMVRFHGADEFTATDLGSGPDVGLELVLEDGHQVWVIDSGVHGEFIASIAASMLGAGGFETVDADAEFESALREADLAAPVVYVDLAPQLGIEEDGQRRQMLAPEAQIIDVLDAIHVSDAVSKEQMVLNMSFGAYTCDGAPPELEAAMQRLAEHGVQFVASAGNDESPDQAWPAGFATRDDALADHVISVGAIEELRGPRSCFSNYGAGVEIWLPGERIFGTRAGQSGVWSGTSFAAPQAAAVLASGIDPVAAGFGAVPLAPPDLFDIVVKLSETQSITAHSFCDPTGPFKPKGAEGSN